MSRHVTVENHPMRAGDLVAYLMAVEARALGEAGVSGTQVDLKETLPGGSTRERHGDLSLLDQVALIDGDTQVSVTWLGRTGRVSLLLQGSVVEKHRLGLTAFASDAAAVSAVLEAFQAAFQAPTINVAPSLGGGRPSRTPGATANGPGAAGEPKRGRSVAAWAISLPVLCAVVAAIVWALTR